MRVSFELDAAAVTTAALAGFVGLFALHAAFPGLYTYWPADSSSLASWVQAFGAIGSIVYAGRLLRRQLQHVEEQHQSQRQTAQLDKHIDQLKTSLELVRAYHALAVHCEMAGYSVEAKLAGRDPNKRHPKTAIERLESLERTIDVMLAKAAPPAATMAMLEIANQIAYARTGLRTLPKNFVPSETAEQALSARMRRQTIQDQVRQLDSFERQLFESLGEAESLGFFRVHHK